ncbi:MAG: ThuA domain-containing protein, partial [Chitinophaga sp.]
MNIRFHVCIFLLVVLAACSQPRSGAIEVLFLGHASEHHHSEKFMPMLASALAPEGIHFTYTNDPASLNGENLARFDALVIYANHDSITPEQEKALVDFVKSGKGFVPLHCASYCFRNSPAYIDMVGGQFQSHDTGTFTAAIINKEHPVTKGLKEFSTWD